MLTLAFTVLKYIYPYLIGAAILSYGYYKSEEFCNHACVAQRTRADGFQAQIKSAQDRATALALLWSAAVANTDKEINDVKAKDAADYARQQDNVRHLSPLPTIRLTGGARLVFNNASDFANGTAPPAPAVSPVPAETISEAALGQYSLDAAAAYKDAYDHWASCTQFYQSLQGAK